MRYLFEVGWEVCNKVGGIHTVLASKAAAAVREFGESYYLLGPLLESAGGGFVETREPWRRPIAEALASKGLRHRCGRWEIEGRPKVILVDFRDHFDVDKLLYRFWQRFGVDSMTGQWDYVEPVLFSAACGEAIEAIHDVLVTEDDEAVAHFHEWMTGGGLLHVKAEVPEIGTVFTTHATVLGRSMAGVGRDLWSAGDDFRPAEEAEARGVVAKHSMETASAREADCFTTVSHVTAGEAEIVLGRRPGRVVFNGLNMAEIGALPELGPVATASRRRLMHIGSRFLRRELPPSTRLWVTSGRYEYHNKGFDILLSSLAALDQWLRGDPGAPGVVVWLLMAGANAGVIEEVRHRVKSDSPHGIGSVGVATHRLFDEANDPVLQSCYRLGLRNGPENRVNVLLTVAYLDGGDGLVDMPYADVLAAADLGVFPSYYEPWGYTPLESIAMGVPTVTTDLAGFGRWARDLVEERGRSVTIVDRTGRSDEEAAADLGAVLKEHAVMDDDELARSRDRAWNIARQADWKEFFGGYLAAYATAADKAQRRVNSLDTSAFSESLFASFRGADGAGPHYRSFTVVAALPEAIADLHEIAYNFWWSWHPEAQELFEGIDEQAWEEAEHNPVRLLGSVSQQALWKRATDKVFLKRYARVLADLRAYLGATTSKVEPCGALGPETPVAYFSMEFCLHECLPIYSGGLGVLAGDHLKSASDLNIPLVAVGLLYRQGYFSQRIDLKGEQIEHYPPLDVSELPLRPLLGEDGQEVRVAVSVARRTVHARAWEALVGRVRLFLLDTDVDENAPRDRQICSRLYGGDRQTRIEQEILLGAGGVRLLEDELGLHPAVYHLNEGHCGFLLVERIARLMKRGGLSFQEAREAVKASSVFTTHTPVPAGNEAFPLELVRTNVASLVGDRGVKWDQVAEIGLASEADSGKEFSMTVLGLKLTSSANAVSALHGEVCRRMWRSVWKHVAVEEVPIGSITNGIHLTSWLGRHMRRLYGQYLEIRWDENHDDPDAWLQVDDIPDDRLWYEHASQKRELIEQVKRTIVEDYARRGESPQLIHETVETLSPDALTIGFARRFAHYKRAYLLFEDRERLARLVSDPERPVQILFAGKAHPADRRGKDLIRAIVDATRSQELRGRVVYLENYDMALGRMMTGGVDVWLNTPVRPHEASGTSGMKAVANGGLNCSILDGWWDEAYSPEVGWAIDSGTHYQNRDHQDEMDALALYELLERRVIPTYYETNDEGIPPRWVEMMKAGIKTLGPRFTTMRMVKQYYTQSYAATAMRTAGLRADNYAGIRNLTAWKRKINARFSTVRIERVTVRGISGDELPSDGVLDIEMVVHRGRLEAQELRAELVVGRGTGERFAEPPGVLPFEPAEPMDDTGLSLFRISHRVEHSGSYRYAVRIVPFHPLLSHAQETGLVVWW